MGKSKEEFQMDNLLEKHGVSSQLTEYFLIDTPDKEAKLDYRLVFGNNNPVVMEIGSGRGELIYQLSKLNPKVNYLGVELSAKRIVTMLKRFDPNVNSNIRLIKAKVDSGFLSCFPHRGLAQAIILHPDPWPKRRHHKKRLINEVFIECLANLIINDGEVYVSTDHRSYAEAILKCFNQHDKYSPVYSDGYRRVPFWDELPTYFEQKMKKEGYTPYYMRYVVLSGKEDS